MNSSAHSGNGIRSAKAFGVALAVAALSALVLPTAAAAVNASSSFTANDQGWRIVQNGLCTAPTVSPPEYFATGGNPGGRISETDNEIGVVGQDGCFWLAVAPASFTGQLRANYGGRVAYDLRHPAGADFGGGVVFSDLQGNVLQAGIDDAAAPTASVWRTYSFTLSDAAAGWSYFAADGSEPAPPTRAQFFAVLANVSTFAVLGDLSYDSQGERTDIDNIDLAEPAVALDSDADGVLNGADNCPLEAGPASNGGCPLAASPPPSAASPPPVQPVAPPATEDGCTVAKAKLAKAKKKVKLLKRSDASRSAINKATKQVKRAQAGVVVKCGHSRVRSAARRRSFRVDSVL